MYLKFVLKMRLCVIWCMCYYSTLFLHVASFKLNEFGAFSLVFDTRLSWPIFVIYIVCCTFTFLDAYHLLIIGQGAVRFIEDIQAFMLLIFAVFTYSYMQPLKLAKGEKYFWLWAVCWWLVLFGRSTSWGRDYFPQVPKIYFRSISVVLIGSVLFSLFNPYLRQEIARKFKSVSISIWAVIMVILGFVISDSIEHERMLGVLFLHQHENRDFMEEIYEFPLIVGLFVIAFNVMKMDKTKFNMLRR